MFHSSQIPLSLNSDLLRGNRFHVKHGVEQVLDDLRLALLPGSLDIANLLLGILVGLGLGLFVALTVL